MCKRESGSSALRLKSTWLLIGSVVVAALLVAAVAMSGCSEVIDRIIDPPAPESVSGDYEIRWSLGNFEFPDTLYICQDPVPAFGEDGDIRYPTQIWDELGRTWVGEYRLVSENDDDVHGVLTASRLFSVMVFKASKRFGRIRLIGGVVGVNEIGGFSAGSGTAKYRSINE